MSRATVIRAHLGVSTLALVTVASALVVTAGVQAFGTDAQSSDMARWSLRLVVLVVALILGAMISGRNLAGGSPAEVFRRKLRRTQLSAATAVIVFLPSAVALGRLAADDDFGVAYGVALTVELGSLLGMIALLGLNFRDGLALHNSRVARSSTRS